MGGKHNLGLSALKNLPLQIADLLLITKNTEKHQNDDSVVIWTNWIDKKKNGIMVSIKINKEGVVEISNSIATVFQAGEKYVNQFFENRDNILYTKNNEDIEKLLPFRRYMPEAKSDDVFIYRVLHNEDDVNREMQKSQDRVDDFLTREQKEFFKDSKVRDEKGNLLKMYHGTPYGGFTVFKNDLNYFTSNKEYADR